MPPTGLSHVCHASRKAKKKKSGHAYKADGPQVTTQSWPAPRLCFILRARQPTQTLTLIMSADKPKWQRAPWWWATWLVIMNCVCVVGAPKSCFPAIFNFGDSNSDTGGLGAAFGAVPSPNGITTFHKPSGRYCDGRLLIDFIAEELELPYLEAYLQSVGSNFKGGANFATAGSTIRPQNTTLAQSGFSPFSLDVQVRQFVEFKQRTLAYHSQEPFTTLLPEPHNFEEALYVVDIGQNDLTAGYFLNLTKQQVQAYIPEVLALFGNHVKALHEQGAKYFLIITTGPVGCLPYILTRLPYTQAEVDKQGCAEPYNKVARSFNIELSAMIRNLQLQLANTTFVVVDGYNLKYNLFVNALEDGFQFTMRACCGFGGGRYNFNLTLGYCGYVGNTNLTYSVCPNPLAFVNWDGIHYTEAANHLMAKGLFSGNFTTPTFSSGHFCSLFVKNS